MKKMSRLLLVALLLITFVAMAQPTKGSSPKRYAIDENGNKMVMKTMGAIPPNPLPPVTLHEIPKEKDGKAIAYLENVPTYDWSFGCTATATSMIVGYYDNFGADNMYIGPSNGGVQPMDNIAWNAQGSADRTSNVPVAASFNGVDGRVIDGHNEDYWVTPDSEDDPYFGAWTEHDYEVGQRATGDFMGTNQFHSWENVDGSTTFWSYMAPSGSKLYDKQDEVSPPSRDGCHGMRLFYESIGYDVTINYTQAVDGFNPSDDNPDEGPVVGGYTWEDYMEAIDLGRPVLIGLTNHSVVGYGYEEPNIVYIRSTWYNEAMQPGVGNPGAETFLWGTDWNGMYHENMTEVFLSPKAYYGAPSNVFALNNNREVTVTWGDPSEGTKTLTYDVYRDDVFLVNVPTESYVDNSVSDGVHTYKTKAIYTDPDPDQESFFSNTAIVYVSISVTEFHDTFEDDQTQPNWPSQPQWLMDYDWGRDTDFD